MGGRVGAAGSGIPQLVLLGVLWGAIFPIARIAVAAGANPFLLVVLDLALASAVMAPVALLSGEARPSGRSLLGSAGLGALLIAGINLPLYWGLQHATGGSASIVYATAPILSLVVLRLLRSSGPVRPRQLGALAVGLGGVVILGLGTTGGNLAAGAAALAAFGVGALCQGVGAVVAGRARPAGEGTWGLTFEFVGGTTAALVALPFLARAPTFPLNATTVGSVAYVGAVGIAVGYLVFFRLIHRFGAVRANQVTFLNPVVAVAAGVLVFGERFVPLEGVALVAIVVALALLQPPSARGSPGPEPVPGKVARAAR